MSVDAALPLRFVAFASQILVAPPTIGVALYLIYRYVGVSTFTGLAFLCISVPLSGFIVKSLFRLRFAALRKADMRVKLTPCVAAVDQQLIHRSPFSPAQALAGIRVLKTYDWERPLEALINGIRDEELHLIEKAAYAMQVRRGDSKHTGAGERFSSVAACLSHIAAVLAGCEAGPSTILLLDLPS
jgi:hypothetical protein